MQIAWLYIEAMTGFVFCLYAQERWKVFGKLANLAWDLVLACWCAMMRHTGDPAYTYKPRRHA